MHEPTAVFVPKAVAEPGTQAVWVYWPAVATAQAAEAVLVPRAVALPEAHIAVV